MTRSLLTASSLVSLALLLSRLSGLIREQVLGARLGLSAETDAAIVMLTLPDLLVGLLLSGGFGAALIPALTRADPVARITLMQKTAFFTVLVTVGLVGALFAAMPVVLSLLAPTLNPNALINFRPGFAVSLLVLPIAATIGVTSAYLSAVGKYSIPALSVLVFNGVLAAYFFFGLDIGTVNFMIFGAVLLGASLLRLSLQISQMPETLRPEQSKHAFTAGFGAQFFQGVLAYSLVVGVPVMFRSLYALGGPGELAAFNYALRVFELPVGILIAPIVVVFLPLLSALRGPDDLTFRHRTDLAMRTAFTVGLIAALIGGVFAKPVVTVLFGYGEMAGGGIADIAGIAQVLLAALPFFAVFQVMATALNASKRTQQVLKCAVSAVLVALVVHTVLRTLLGFGTGTSAQIGFVVFHVAACYFAVFAVYGKSGIVGALYQLIGSGSRITLLTIPVALLNPSLRDSIVTLWDIVLISCLGGFLLLVNAGIFMELAKLRDTRLKI